jgi:hypothetical protein
LNAVNEAHFSEIEKVLLYISDARVRAERAAREISNGGADQHLVASLESTERELKELHRRLTQTTYFSVPEPTAGQEKLAV